jgi:drug/metabolite transporter, DME family
VQRDCRYLPSRDWNWQRSSRLIDHFYRKGILETRGAFLVILGAVALGPFGVLASLMLTAGLGVLTQTFWRFLLSGIVFFSTALALFRRKAFPSIDQLPFVLSTGAVMLLLSLTYISAIDVGTPVPVVAFLVNTSTLFILVLSAVFLKEHLTRRKTLAAMVGVVAVVLLSHVWEATSAGGALGDGLAVLNALLFGVLTIVNRRLVQQVNPQLVTTWVFLGAALWSLLLLAGGYVSLELNAYQIGLVALMALVSTFAAYSLVNWGMERVNASTTGIILYAVPVTAAFLSYPFLGEVLSITEALGAVLVLVSILVLWERST